MEEVTETASARRTPSAAGLGHALLLILPGALMVWLSFNGGGFFAKEAAVAALVLLMALLLWMNLSASPFGRSTGLLTLAVSALALLGVWILVSAAWSDSPARSVLEFDRLLIYLTALLLFGLCTRGETDVRWLVRLLALAATAVCVAAFASHIYSDVWVRPMGKVLRLDYPITYWNALALVAALGVVLCFYMTSSEAEPRWLRVAAAAPLPLLPCVMLFTLSRAAIAMAAFGVVVFVVLGRPRATLTGLIATVPASAVAAVATYRSPLLSPSDSLEGNLVGKAHELGLLVVGCVIAACLLRLILLPVDRRLAGIAVSPRVRRSMLIVGLVGTIAGLGVAWFGLDVPSKVSAQYDRFVRNDSVRSIDARKRLSDPGNNKRLDIWGAALDQFEATPVRGSGAGTFELTWFRRRHVNSRFSEGHSLYLESLADLGIVGCALVVIALLAILVSIATRIRGPNRVLYASVFAAALMWTVHAGVDLDWEMPAASLWFFPLTGAALSARSVPRTRSPGRSARVLIGLGVLLLAVSPALVALSQQRYEHAEQAFRHADCPAAIDASLSALSVFPVRPEPFQVLGYCDARLGQRGLAVRAMKASIARDPHNWAPHYGLAVVQAAAGLDPRPEARIARRLNPKTFFTRELVREFSTGDRSKWTRRARRARLVIR
jgi:hypothetical protein